MKIGVIGAGVVGVSAAWALVQRGREVVVFDRKGIATGASRGNAGAFGFADIFTDIVPLATPGIMHRASSWLLNPNGPLSIPPSYMLRIAPWLLSFWRAGRPNRYRASRFSGIREEVQT
jgi:D-amino-acid dehydrogenase